MQLHFLTLYHQDVRSDCETVFLITFQVWAKLAQQWLVCAPLGIHFEPINKELMLLVTI